MFITSAATGAAWNGCARLSRVARATDATSNLFGLRLQRVASRSRVDLDVLERVGLAREDETLHAIGGAQGVLNGHGDATRDEWRLALAADAGPTLERQLQAGGFGRFEHRLPRRRLDGFAGAPEHDRGG